MNIYDVAEACGVSIATVSRVLNGSARVSERTRAKVLSVMEAQGYQPNAFARGLGLGSMKMLGILCTDVSDPFYAHAVACLESGLKRMGYDLLLYCTGAAQADKRRYTDLLLSKKVDGIVLVGSVFADEENLAHLERAAQQVPVVIINGSLPSDHICCVDTDAQEQFASVVRALHAQGARRILYLYDVLTYGGQQKLRGYRSGLESVSLPFDPMLCRRLPRDLFAAAAAVQAMLCEGTDFDAVLCSEDLFAVAAGKALAASGLHVPVVGCNNSILAQCASPAVSSIDLMLESMCDSAMHTLHSLLEGREAPRRVVISSRLIARETFTP